MTDDLGVCPRCEGPLVDYPEDEPALSAFTEPDIEVCLSCAADEGLRFTQGDVLIPQHEWPIREGAHDYIETFGLDPDRDS